MSVSLFSAEHNSKISGFTKIKLQTANEYKKSNNSIQNIQNIQYPYKLVNSKLYIDLMIKLDNPSSVELLKSLG
jgi:hypothetical protein